MPFDVADIMPWVVIGVVLATVVFIVWAVPVRVWIAAIAAGVPISLVDLIGMRLRRINPRSVVEPLIMARKAGLDLTVRQLETHSMSGGSVDRVVRALIAARRGDISITWEKAAKLDLQGQDVMETVKGMIERKGSESSAGSGAERC